MAMMKPYRLLSICTLLSVALAILLGIRFSQRTSKIHAAGQSPVLTPNKNTPVLVELFTAEGCSSCPPADALLGRLDRDQPVPNTDIIVLSEHVDYWNHLGWEDRFSSPEITQRQKDYQESFKLDDIYTPQAVINGSAEFVGSNEKAILEAIEHPKVATTIALQFSSVLIHRNIVTFNLLGGLPATPGSVNVYAALVDPVATTEVHAGENNGRTLHHAGAARSFAIVGSSLHTNAIGERPFTMNFNQPGQLSPLKSVNGMRLVVFVQKPHNGPVVGAVSCLLPPPGSPAAQAPFPSNPCPIVIG